MPKHVKEKKSGKLQWFVLIFFVPSLFAVLIGMVLLSLLGINVIDLGRNAALDLPVVSSFYDEQTEENTKETTQSKEQLQAKEQEIIRLQNELEEKETRISELQSEREELELEIEAEQEYQEAIRSDLKELAKVYENMSAGKAASILSEMETSDIIRHMAEMKIDMQGEILGKMDPPKAAEVLQEMEK